MVHTTVQELAVTAKEPPPQYMVDEVLAADEMPKPIPLIDLSRLTTAADEADKLRATLKTRGLFLATNHGIEESLMDVMMSASRDFLRQPSEEKQKYNNLIVGKHFEMEGYGNDKVVTPQDQGLSWNDRLHLRVEPEDRGISPSDPLTRNLSGMCFMSTHQEPRE
uniref:Non-haem dioxygenase N-terminal domain-containing protein n=1 Tax=Aegilops tauschii subsp. strangulata TaxID=200361 RepID=A0A453Q9A2_AEGTS